MKKHINEYIEFQRFMQYLSCLAIQIKGIFEIYQNFGQKYACVATNLKFHDKKSSGWMGGWRGRWLKQPNLKSSGLYIYIC